MTAIFRGAEDVNFSPIGGPTVSTNAATFASGYARCSLYATSVDLGSNSQAWRIPASFGLSLADFWFTARMYYSGTNPEVGDQPWLSFNDTSDRVRLRVMIPAAGGGSTHGLGLYIQKVDASGTATLLTNFTGAVAVDTLSKIDVNINYSTTGFIRLYADGDLLASYSGDVTTNGLTSLGGVDMAGWTNWSEVILDTTDTRSMRLVSIVPNATGNLDQWSGTYSDVSNIVNTDNTFNSTPSATQTQLYQASDLPTTDLSIVDYTLSLRAAAQVGGPQHLDPTVYTNGGQYNNSAVSLGPSLQPYFSIWTTNPATGLPWTAADINALQEGMESAT